MAEHPELRPATPFVPSAEQLEHMPKFRENDIPRYLFRIHAGPTAGTTTTSYVIPPASGAGNPGLCGDLFSYPVKEAGKNLCHHLNWVLSHECKCNLISWTSSLLFALQYGFYRHQGDKMKRKSPLSEIKIMVVDTRGLPPGTFVKDVEIMRAMTLDLPRVAGLPRREDLHGFLSFRENPRKYGKRHYFGEYLSQGDLRLEGRCAQAPMNILTDLGLFDLQPGFKDEAEWALWVKPVLRLRVPFGKLDMFPPIVPSTDQAQVRRAIVLASACFGDHFTVPVAAMLLALTAPGG